MIQFILFNQFLIVLMLIAKYCFGFNDNVHIELIFGIVTVLLFLFKLTGNKSILIHGILMIIIFTIWKSLALSGGIFSYNLRWLLVPIVFAFLFLTVQAGLFYILVSCLICLVQYRLVYHLDLVDNFGFYAHDYFLDNIFLFLGVTVSLAVFYYGELKFKNEINAKNIQLESNKNHLLAATNELETTTQQLTESNNNLKQYANMTAHDLTQPVRTIKSFAELAKMKTMSDKSKKEVISHLDFVINSADGLHEKIKELLDIANSFHQSTPKLGSLRLDDVLLKARTNLTTLIEETETKINIGKLPKVIGSKVKLENVFQNLIENAIKYSPNFQKPEVWIDSEEKKDHFLISVRDNGMGMGKNELTKIFHSFQQRDSSVEGVGLGLYICKRHVEFHKGEIWVDSTKGEGSTFYFTLPKRF